MEVTQMAMTTHSATEKDSMVRYIGLVIGLLIVLPTVARAQTETVVYFHTDAVGSVRMTTDASGQVIQRYDYAPFGEPLPAPTPETRRFAGGELDPETELNYFGARQYQPQTGRFTRTDDPGYGNPFDPQSMNFYAYVMNNPLRWVDPSGHHHQGGCHEIAEYPYPVCPGVDIGVTPDPQPPYFPFFPPNYPGGGGGGGAQGPKTPTGTPEKLRILLVEGFAEALRKLKQQKCGDFFGGQGPDVLNSTDYRFLSPASNQPDATAMILGPRHVGINPTGPFVTGPPKTNMYGRFWTAPDFRGFILLHELGHQVGKYGNDAGNLRLNEANSKKVVNACY
ncbi:MAG: RHS repeat domain-containing protein [Vicinamibacterales bacterium]